MPSEPNRSDCTALHRRVSFACRRPSQQKRKPEPSSSYDPGPGLLCRTGNGWCDEPQSRPRNIPDVILPPTDHRRQASSWARRRTGEIKPLSTSSKTVLSALSKMPQPHPPRNRPGSVFQYQTFDNHAFNYQTFEWGTLRVSNHPVPTPKNIRFSKFDDADSEKSVDEADAGANDKDTRPPTPDPEPVEILSLDDPEAHHGQCQCINCRHVLTILQKLQTQSVTTPLH